MPNGKEALLAALSCLTQGVAPKGRYQALNRGTSNLVLRDAIEELVDLRAELEQQYCRECNKMYLVRDSKITICPACGLQMTSLAHAQLQAVRHQVTHLEEKIALLETVIQAFSTF